MATNAQWQSLAGGLVHQVKDMELSTDSQSLIIAGSFKYTAIDSLLANGIAKWDGVAWSIDGFGGGSGDTLGTGNLFMSFALFRDTLFAGVLTDHFQYHPEWQLGAGLYNNEWFAIGNPENWFYVMTVNERLFSGGRADTLYGQFMPGIREWVDGAWHPVPGCPLDETGTYYCATWWHDTYWFAGSFISGGARSVIAYDGEDQWTPNWGPGGGWINSIAGFGDSLYVGGWYPPGSDSESPFIQLWDGSDWRPFFAEVLQFYDQIYDLEVYDGALYVSGLFHFLDDPNTRYNLLRFDGQHLCAIGGPNPESSNGVIAFFQGDLYMATTYLFPGLVGEHVGRLPLDGLVPDRCLEVTTSTPEETSLQGLRLFPNPTNEVLIVSGLADLDNAKVQVIDVLGRELTSPTPITTAATSVDVSGLEAGTYRLRVVSGSRTETRSFIKL